jgi:excisionase family DNA binding protein
MILSEQELIDKIADAVVARLPASTRTKRLMTIKETAEYIGRSQNAVRSLIVEGTLPVTRLDGKRQIDVAALDSLIRDSTRFDVV